MHDYCVFDCFLFLLSFFQPVSYIKCMIIVCLSIFSSIFVTILDSELYKVHDYCAFDCFLFNIVSISECELHKVHDYCLFDYFLFNFVTFSAGELHKVHDYCVFDYFFSILSPFQSVSCIKCMIIVCLTIFLFNFFHHFSR